jgi:hypothetical protein
MSFKILQIRSASPKVQTARVRLWLMASSSGTRLFQLLPGTIETWVSCGQAHLTSTSDSTLPAQSSLLRLTLPLNLNFLKVFFFF